jgi:Core-2/I-Branching enzyme
MIHFSIQHHGQQWTHLHWLVRALAGEHGRVDVTLDAPAADVATLAAEIGPLATVRRSQPVIWAGPSVMQQMRESLLFAADRPGWEWFINLSGSCIPLRPPARMLAVLERQRADTGLHSHLFAFPVRRAPVWLAYSGPGSGQRQPLFRISVLADRVVEDLMAAPGEPFNPMSSIELRRTLACTECCSETDKFMQLRALTAPELRDRQQFWSRHPYVIGRQWVVLHRSVVEWLVESPQAAEVATLLSQTFLPDETFFQTALTQAPQTLRAGIGTRHNLRGQLGASGAGSPEALRQARADGALFARKAKGHLPTLHALVEHELWGDS